MELGPTSITTYLSVIGNQLHNSISLNLNILIITLLGHTIQLKFLFIWFCSSYYKWFLFYSILKLQSNILILEIYGQLRLKLGKLPRMKLNDNRNKQERGSIVQTNPIKLNKIKNHCLSNQLLIQLKKRKSSYKSNKHSSLADSKAKNLSHSFITDSSFRAHFISDIMNMFSFQHPLATHFSLLFL